MIGKVEDYGVADEWMHGLSAEERAEISDAPREKKFPLLMEYTGLETEVLVSRLSNNKLSYEKKPILEDDILSLLPLRLIFLFKCLPVKDSRASNSAIKLATLWPPEKQYDEWVYAITERHVEWVLTDSEWLMNQINTLFGVGSGSLEEDDVDQFETQSDHEIEEDEETAIIKFVNDVVAQAIKDRATDIHVEPRKEQLNIRYRIDGHLVPVSLPQNLVKFQSAIISRVKIMAKLNISERRKPQDGRIQYQGLGQEIDIRVSTLPTMYGESISMRLLNEQSQPLSITDIGVLASDIPEMEVVLNKPHGIVLITGPTGSGKSTTLSSFMRHIARPEKRIITVEDPVEYEIPEVNQTQVQSEIGLTFASVLRSVLRQDPDIIMVGEIRDKETADIAIRASLTGHMVLSTLHTNDAPGALTRLIDMEIEPFLVASSVEMIIAQRLVRRLCKKCSIKDLEIKQDALKRAAQSLGVVWDANNSMPNIYKAIGCENCRQLGYRGRIGLFEVLYVRDELHDLIVNKASAREMRKLSLSMGMRTLQSCGWEHVMAGETTLEEVLRYSDFGEEEAG